MRRRASRVDADGGALRKRLRCFANASVRTLRVYAGPGDGLTTSTRRRRCGRHTKWRMRAVSNARRRGDRPGTVAEKRPYAFWRLSFGAKVWDAPRQLAAFPPPWTGHSALGNVPDFLCWATRAALLVSVRLCTRCRLFFPPEWCMRSGRLARFLAPWIIPDCSWVFGQLLLVLIISCGSCGCHNIAAVLQKGPSDGRSCGSCS